jgi:MFS family permease
MSIKICRFSNYWIRIGSNNDFSLKLIRLQFITFSINYGVLGQSLVAFFRMIGPTIGGSLTSWSLQLEIGWHVNHFIPFLVLMILLFCLYVLTVAKLPVRLNKPKQEQDLREALNELNFIQSSAEQ